MHSTQLTISVIIPVHNGGSSFRQCLSSLSNLANVYEIIIVADGDTDGSGSVAEEFDVKVLRTSSRKGPAYARNFGASVAKGDILLFIDADVTIKPDIINRIQAVFECEPDLSALIGSYDDTPGATNFLSQYKNLFHHYTHQTANEEAFTFWGACGAIRRQVFQHLGGFDESYRQPSIEDIELGDRIKGAGYRIRLCKDLQVKHLKRWNTLSLLKAEIFYRALPWTELIWSRRQLNNDLNLGITSRLSLVLVFALVGALIATWWYSEFLFLALGLAVLLYWLNSPVYEFFLQKRGLWFTLRVIPWHWFYYLYGGVAFAFGTCYYLWHQLLTPTLRNQSKNNITIHE